jgi:hypothetical protein
MVQFDDDTYGEKRAIEKLFWCIPEKYKQITRSIESLLDLYTMSIEEAIGHLNVVNDDEPQPLSGPITVDGKLHLTRCRYPADQVPPCTSSRSRQNARHANHTLPRVHNLTMNRIARGSSGAASCLAALAPAA